MKIFNGNITQLNTGTLEGNLFNTFNCDLTFDKGKMSVAPQTIQTTDSILSSLTNMRTPTGFRFFDTKWHCPSGSRVFYNSGTGNGNFVEDANTPTTMSSLYSDIEIFGDVLLVSAAGTLYSKAANGSGTGSYTSRRSFGGSADYHAICSYNNRAYWVDLATQIFSMNTAYTVVSTTALTYTMKLPTNYVITFIRAYSNGIYIGTIDKNGGEGLVFDWDGVTADKWNRAYRVYANGALAGHVVNDVLEIVNTNGELLRFNGSGFTSLGRLPIKRDLLWQATNTTTADRFIHPNGMASIKGNTCILINNKLNTTTEARYLTNIHSGIWEYDGVSLYHKYALSFTTSTGTIIDYGQITLNTVGGLCGVPDMNSADATKGNFLAGASYYTTSSTSTGIGYGTWTDNYYDTLQKSGFFSTQQIRSEHFNDMFQRATLLYNPTSGMSFVVKYRAGAPETTMFNGTWASGTTLTTTTSTISAGDEVTVMQGRGSGRVAHVSSVSGSGTYTLTLDETISGIAVGSTFVARTENWKKIGTITNTNAKFQPNIIGKPDTLIELKVAMLGTGEVTVDEMVLDNNKNQ